MSDSNATQSAPGDDMISYEEAAALMGKSANSVYNMVGRRQLHTFPDPEDRRRRLLSRREVEARARFLDEHVRGIKPADHMVRARSMEQAPRFSSDEARSFLLLVAGVALGAASLYVLVKSEDVQARALALSMIVSLALLALNEMEKAREIDAVERRKLEQRVAQLEATADIDELQKIIDRGELAVRRASLENVS